VFLDFGPVATAEVTWRFDASTDWGMGAFMWDYESGDAFYILHEWSDDERELSKGPERESTTILEGITAVYCTVAFARHSRGKRVLMEGDNIGVAHGLRKCYSKDELTMGHIHSVWDEVSTHGVVLRTSHIIGKHFNVIADHLSHNRIPQALAQALRDHGITLNRLACHEIL
jgi:hypothetical protein